jgi:hypothetical protein
VFSPSTTPSPSTSREGSRDWPPNQVSPTPPVPLPHYSIYSICLFR